MTSNTDQIVPKHNHAETQTHVHFHLVAAGLACLCLQCMCGFKLGGYVVSVGQGKNVCLLLQMWDTPSANACTSWGTHTSHEQTVHETTLKIFLRCNKCKTGMCLKIIQLLSSIFCKKKSWFQILGIILLAIRRKKNTRRSCLTYLSNPHVHRCFILLADGKGLYTMSKVNANLRIVWHLKPIWKKIFLVGEFKKNLLFHFRVCNLEIWRNDFAWKLALLFVNQEMNFFWFVFWKRRNMAEIF